MQERPLREDPQSWVKEGSGQLRSLTTLFLSWSLGVGCEGHPLPAPGDPPPTAPPLLCPWSRLPAQRRENKAADLGGWGGPSLQSLAPPGAVARPRGQGTAQVPAETRLCCLTSHVPWARASGPLGPDSCLHPGISMLMPPLPQSANRSTDAICKAGPPLPESAGPHCPPVHCTRHLLGRDTG